MKRFISLVITIWFCTISFAQTTENAKLKVHYNFVSLNSAVGGYTGALYNGAFLTTVGGLPVLSLGNNNGYFDMGASVGNVIATLNDFTISTNVYIPSSTTLGVNGNFIYTFANSTNIANDANGCIFFGANETRYTICMTNYQAEKNVIANYRFPTGTWHTLTYRQTNKYGELFLDGVKVASNTISINPSQLGATPYNFIRRPCYQGDVYLKNAQYNDFRIYDGAVNDATIEALTYNLDLLNGELYATQIEEVMAITEIEPKILYDDITLPLSGENGVCITWSSSNEDVVTATGEVTRPAYGNGNVHVTLTATFSKEGVARQKTFNIEVVAYEMDDNAIVEADMNSLVIHGNLDNLKSNLYLPTKGHNGSTISWTSSRPDILSDEGEILMQSPNGQLHVELRATISMREVQSMRYYYVSVAKKEPYAYYLFAYFNGNSQWQEQICFALSTDGYNYTPLNNGNPIINSADIALKQAVRDPHILRGEDGYFYMVVTDMRSSQGWSSNDGLVLLRSADMVNWTHSAIDFPTAWPHRFDRNTLTQVWAPQTIYDPEEGKYMVYYAIGESGKNYITYYSYANEDFTELTEPQVLYNHGGMNTIDADIVWHDGMYHMFFKTEGQGNGIQKATAKRLRGVWTPEYKYLQQTSVAVEGSGVFKLIDSDTWVLMYDCYTSGMYEFCTSTDLRTFTKVCNSANTSIFTPRHGTTIAITAEEARRLVDKWPSDGLNVAGWTDITDICVKNPRFDNNSSNGWKSESNAEGQNLNYNAMEYWNGDFHLQQTVNVPNGKYRLSAQAFYNTTGDEMAYLYANDMRKAIVPRNSEGVEEDYIGNCDLIEIDGSMRYIPTNMQTGAYCFEHNIYNNSLEVEVTDGTLTFGLICENHTHANWCMFDNFKLEYLGTISAIEAIELSYTSISINEGENFTLAASIVPEDALTQGLIWFSEDESIATVNQNGVVRAHKKGSTKIVVEAADGSGVRAICAVTVDQLQGTWIDVTDAYITNPGFDNNSKEGWHNNSNASSQNTGNGGMEFWNGYFNIYQTVTVPNGKYRLSVQAYYRTAENNVAYPNYVNNTENITAYLYANENKEEVASVYSEYLTSLSNDNDFYKVYGSTIAYYPNTMATGAYCFEQDMYHNSVIVDVTDGTLQFGLLCESYEKSNWCMFDNFKLEFYGNLIPVTSISLSQSNLSLIVGEKSTITATVHPSNATYQKVNWYSDNPLIADVDNNGIVTAYQGGKTIIYAEASDGSGISASCQVIVASSAPTADAIIINEIQSANIDMFVDPSFNYGGWVELYNPTSQPVSLNYLYVSDDAANLTKYNLGKERGVIPAKGYYVLWFDHCNNQFPSQIDFKLDYDGGDFYISDADGNLIVSQAYPMAVPRTSYARITDGAEEWGRTAEPTPGGSNADSRFATERVVAPIVNKDACLFTNPFTFNVQIPVGTTLRYTTDGTTPTLTNGLTSTDGTFSVKNTTTFRFCLYEEGKLPSQVITRSFIYKDKDYTLPVISVVTDPINLYDDSLGVYVEGVNGRTGNGKNTPCNWNMDWDRPVNFEYITPEGEMVVNQEVDFAMCGGWSRAWTPHSFKLKASKIYEGNNSINYPFFEEKPYLKHKTLQIRNGGNDNNCRIKDAALQEIVHRSGIDIDGQSTQPIVHFINGEYKGMLNMREPNNKHFAYANWGIDTDEMDQFEMSPDSGYVQMEGTRDAFLHWYELSANAADEATYEEIRQLVDIDEYINYMAVEFYLGGTDWPQNNIKGFRPRIENGRFRFVLFDLDGAFATTNSFSTFEGKKTHRFDYIYDLGGHLTEEIEMVTIFLNMLENESFRKQFIDTYCLVVGSIFEPNRCNDIIDEMAAKIAPALAFEGLSPYGTANQLKSSLSNRQNKMIQTLVNYWRMQLNYEQYHDLSISANVDGVSLRVNDQEIPTEKFNGTLFSPITIKAEPKSGYRFVGWGYNNELVEDEKILVSSNAEWNYYDKGTLDGDEWMSPSYTTTSWSKGYAPLGYYTGDSNNSRGYNTILDYGADADNKRPTYYFRSSFNISERSADDRFVLHYTVDDGMIIYINGEEAARYLMPSGTVYYDTYASTYADGNPDNGSITLDDSLFKKGVNTIAVEVHNCDNKSSDIYFDIQLSQIKAAEISKTIICEDTEYTLSQGEQGDFIAYYEPLTVEDMIKADNRPVRINEISADNSIYVNEYYKKNDWIELFNTTSEPIDVSGMYLSDNPDNPMKYQIIGGDGINTIIEPFSYLIIWADKLMTFTQLHAPFKLATEGGYVVLTASDQSWNDVLYYESHYGTESVGLYPDGSNNVYIMTVPTIAQTNIINSYAAWLEQPTSPVNAIEEESMERMQLRYANRTLYIHGNGATSARVTIYNATGQRCMVTTTEFVERDATIGMTALTEGTYIVSVTSSNGETETMKLRLK